MGEGVKEENQKEVIFEIPVDGSLGLLALGHIGLLEWRKKRDEYSRINNSAGKNVK